jgi:hypothetical protein
MGLIFENTQKKTMQAYFIITQKSCWNQYFFFVIFSVGTIGVEEKEEALFFFCWQR